MAYPCIVCGEMVDLSSSHDCPAQRAWDRFAAAALCGLTSTAQQRNDADEDATTAAEIADALLAERRKRFPK